MTKDEVIDLIKDAGYGVLSTVEGNAPKVRPMMPFLTDEGNLLIATFSQKRVIAQIKENSSVEMCFIDRKMNWCRVSGEANISQEKEEKELIWNNVPMLRQFFASTDDPNLVIINIDTRTVESMTPQDKKPSVLSLK